VDAQRALLAIENVLTENVPCGAHVTVTGQSSADGWFSPRISPWLERALDTASQQAFGRPASFSGEGGTIPFLASLARRYPGVQFLATGVLGPGSNAHGIDEMLDLPTTVAVTNVVSSVVAAFGHRKEEP
jgi:acetylornithine deacetylase/succinyl-diaminopimelate desuccinylase-like protein